MASEFRLDRWKQALSAISAHLLNVYMGLLSRTKGSIMSVATNRGSLRFSQIRMRADCFELSLFGRIAS